MENNKLLIGLIAGVAVVGLYLNWKNSNNIKKLAAGTLSPKDVERTICTPFGANHSFLWYL